MSSEKTEKMSVHMSPFAVLGIPESSSREDIRKAYREKVLLYHPDVNGSETEAEFKQVVRAYRDISKNNFSYTGEDPALSREVFCNVHIPVKISVADLMRSSKIPVTTQCKHGQRRFFVNFSEFDQRGSFLVRFDNCSFFLLLDVQNGPYSLEGKDVVMQLEVSAKDLRKGTNCTVLLPTEQLKFRIPARTASGTRLRLSGKGLASPGSDLLVQVVAI